MSRFAHQPFHLVHAGSDASAGRELRTNGGYRAGNLDPMEVVETLIATNESPVALSVTESARTPLGLTAKTWSRIRAAAMAQYVVATALYLRSTEAIPSDREIIAGWILGLALVATIGRTRRDVVVTLASWVPFLLALFLYDFARAVGHWLDAPLAVTPQITIDRWLGGGRLWTERLQGWLVSPKAGLGRLTVAESERILKTDPSTVRWYDIGVSAVYQSHFIVPYLTAGILWRNRVRWRWYGATFVAVNFASCAIFALYATAPPWYAARQGLIDPFPRVLAGRAWSHVGLNFASRVIEKGQGTVNPFAAIPSLHSAQALMVCVFLWGVVWKPLRPLLVLFPLAMAFALVYSGEHYLIDVFAGWGMVALALTIGWRLRMRKGWVSPFRWPGRRGTVASSPPGSPAPATSPADGSSADGPGRLVVSSHGLERRIASPVAEIGDGSPAADRSGVATP